MELNDKQAAEIFSNAYELQKAKPQELQAILEKIGDKKSDRYQLLLAGKREYEKQKFKEDLYSNQKEQDEEKEH